MHVWIVEVKETKDHKFEPWSMWTSRKAARSDASWIKGISYKTRVVKYISSKGE